MNINNLYVFLILFIPVFKSENTRLENYFILNDFLEYSYLVFYLTPRTCQDINVDCIGTLIEPKWILTSAECIKCHYENNNDSYITVPRILKGEFSVKKYHIDSHIYHELYKRDITCKTRVFKTKYEIDLKPFGLMFKELDYFFIENDIGLIKIKEPVETYPYSLPNLIDNSKDMTPLCKSLISPDSITIIDCSIIKERVENCAMRKMFILGNPCEKFLVSFDNEVELFPSGFPLICKDKLIGIYSIPHVSNRTEHLWTRIDKNWVNMQIEEIPKNTVEMLTQMWASEAGTEVLHGYFLVTCTLINKFR